MKMSHFLKLASGSSTITLALLPQANPRTRNMQRSPALRSAIVVLCLFLAGAFSAAFAAPRPRLAPRNRAPRSPPTQAPLSSSVSHRSSDPGKDDVATYDDPMIRQIALDALGHEKGSVVAVDPTNGRILAIVNQKMAFSSGFEPCSTIKPFIALAGLSEGVITRDTMIEVKRRRYMDLTEAMAHSNNNFFEEVGTRLGFDRVIKYDSMFGLGQRVGYNIPEEQPGSLPSHPPIFGGVARMSSFGAEHSHHAVPAGFARIHAGQRRHAVLPAVSAHRAKRAEFRPRVRQQFDIQPLIPDIREGMLAAVLYGTAKRSYDPYDGEQALGKTGTCNDEGVGGRLGWFVSYADQANPQNRDRRAAARRGAHHQRSARFGNRRPHLSQSLPAQLFHRQGHHSLFNLRRLYRHRSADTPFYKLDCLGPAARKQLRVAPSRLLRPRHEVLREEPSARDHPAYRGGRGMQLHKLLHPKTPAGSTRLACSASPKTGARRLLRRAAARLESACRRASR